jgi:voltage-gated potassium channel
LHGARRLFLLGTVLVTLGVGGNIFALTGAGTFFIYLSLCSYIIFLLLTISLAIRQVIRSGTVDANSIIGAVCIYLLIGVIWSLFYVLVNILIPGSFSVQISGSAFEQLQAFLYYSFVTLTTLGYGDIAPIRETARALSTIEAILGQFYIATLVAGLVAAFITRKEPTSTGS